MLTFLVFGFLVLTFKIAILHIVSKSQIFHKQFLTKQAKMVVMVLAFALLHLLPFSAKSQDEPRIPVSSVPLVISSQVRITLPAT